MPRHKYDGNKARFAVKRVRESTADSNEALYEISHGDPNIPLKGWLLARIATNLIKTLLATDEIESVMDEYSDSTNGEA